MRHINMSRGFPAQPITLLSILLFTLLLANCASQRAANKERVDALQNMAGYELREGNEREALGHLLEAEKLDPDDPELSYEIAKVYRDINEYDLSLHYFKKTLELKPDYSEAWNDLGILYSKSQKWDPAIQSFQRAVDNLLYKTPDIAYNNMGLVYYRKGEYQKAIECYMKAINTFHYATYYTNLGLAYEAINRWDNAVDAYKDSIRIDKEYTTPYLRLGKIYYKLKMKKEARDILEQLLALDKEGPHTLEAKKILIELDE
jgi:type IV pilus assembly protein PilF